MIDDMIDSFIPFLCVVLGGTLWLGAREVVRSCCPPYVLGVFDVVSCGAIGGVVLFAFLAAVPRGQR